MRNDYLMHYGVKGMKWGVRRYQNKDGSLTAEGKEQKMYADRTRRSAKTKEDMDRLYNKLSREDKKLLGDDNGAKEWLTIQEGEYVVKRMMKKIGNEPVSAIDIMTTTKNGHLTVAIMTDPNSRGSGYASELVAKGVKWYDKNKKRLHATSLSWGAYQSNTASKRIAEKSGFKYNKKASSDDWAVYDYH